MPFRFHVYGSPVFDNDTYTAAFAKLENLNYHGPFNGLTSLPTDRYDVFLYTSQWDGLPNVLLEAILSNLPIIASAVGGVAELIINEKTGFLINPYDDVDKYVSCLKRITNDVSLIRNIISNARTLLIKRHSWDIFIESLKSIRGYVASNELNPLVERKGELEFKKK